MSAPSLEPTAPNAESATGVLSEDAAQAFEKWVNQLAQPNYPQDLYGRLKFAWFAALEYKASLSSASGSLARVAEEEKWHAVSVGHLTVDVRDANNRLLVAGLDDLAGENAIRFHNASVDRLARVVEQLRELIRHCWIHGNHRNCGFLQMTTEQKELYSSIIEHHEDSDWWNEVRDSQLRSKDLEET